MTEPGSHTDTTQLPGYEKQSLGKAKVQPQEEKKKDKTTKTSQKNPKNKAPQDVYS